MQKTKTENKWPQKGTFFYPSQIPEHIHLALIQTVDCVDFFDLIKN